MSTRAAAWSSAAWLVLGFAVGLPLLLVAGSTRTVDYWAVYVVERSLSLDNVFVFLLILSYFEVPPRHRRHVVRWGIVFALALRAAAIAAGAALVERFDVVTYLLGAVLLVFAWRMLRRRDEPMDPQASPVVRAVRRVAPVTSETESGRFLARDGDGWAITPLGLALVAIIAADITFAVDSIPASFGITTDVLVIWLANVLALLGLVPLLVLVRALVQRFRYMAQTLAVVLMFIAVRLLTEQVVELGPLTSLAVIVAILAVGLAASVVADRRAPPHEHARAKRRPPRCPPGHAPPAAAER